MHDDPQLPLVFTRAEALGAGATAHQIAHRVRTGRWLTLGRGIYTFAHLHAGLSPRQRHILAVLAVLTRRGEEVVASHLSAAMLHGFLLPLDGAGPPTLTCADRGSWTVRQTGLVVQVAALPEADRTRRRLRIGGSAWDIRCTSPARTVADLLRHLDHPDGVAIADAALRAGMTSYEAVARVLDRQAQWPYGRHGLVGLRLVDPRRESWLESFSFVHLHELGLPMPEPQVTILDPRGRPLGRVDGWLERSALALEADGRDKYLLNAAGARLDPGAAADEVLRRVRSRLTAEKEREDRMRELGVGFVRWGTHDVVTDLRGLLERIQAARRHGDLGHFRGGTAYLPPPAWWSPRRRSAG